MRRPFPRRGFLLGSPALLLGCETAPIAPSTPQPLPTARPGATAWPLDQSAMQPGPARSSNIATLPADLAITPAGPEVPEMLRRALGHWRGYGGVSREYSVAVAIQSVTEVGGIGAFDVTTSVNPAFRVGWSFVVMHGNELKGALSNNFAVLTMRPRPDGHMDLLFEGGRLRFSGVMTRLT